MSDLPSGRLVFAVAQLPFDTANADTMNVNTFGTLVPILDQNGRSANREDYPQAGLVWWMLRASARAYAEPGRLVSGRLEYATRYDPQDPSSHLFQVEFESVEPVRSNTAIEILTVTSTRAKHPRDLVSLPGLVEVDHPPSEFVLVRFRESVIGPLRTSAERRADGLYAVSLAAPGVDREVMRIPASALAALKQGSLCTVGADVSLENRSVENAANVRRCQYELLSASGLNALEAGQFETIPLLRDDELLKRVAKPLLQRKERQQFSALLDKLAGDLTAGSANDADVIDLISRTQERLRRGDELADELADALLRSGLIDESLQARVAAQAREYVESSVASLRAQISERTREIQEPLERLREERVRLDEEVQRRRREAHDEIETELREARRQHDERMRGDLAGLSAQQQDLERQRALVIDQLESVTRRYGEARGEVVQDFLVLLPLLERVLPLVAANTGRGDSSAAASSADVAREVEAASDVQQQPFAERGLAFPQFVIGEDESPAEISEGEFLERFRTHVRECGFEYRDLDLMSFHVSIKSGDLTILGGVSGTGKSSLPQMYAAALAGEGVRDDTVPEGRYLHVSVRPSWFDQQDLLGHVNSIDGRFVPSESGLYEFAIWAQREAELQQGRSGVYLACLDEMNLSHVEHYFSGFLQALERPEGLRTVRCFDARSLRADDPWRTYNHLSIPRSLRFVGTVNYDETTKPLSLRLLDRANVVQLQATNLRGVELGELHRSARRAAGPSVRWQDLRSWARDAELDRHLAELLDRLRAPLAALHTPLTPRRDKAIRRFVASATGVVPSPWVAFDLQLVQRVLPQIRSVFGPEGRQALEDLTRIVAAHASDLPEAHRALNALAERELGGLDV